MTRPWLVVLVAVGCGRIGFDEHLAADTHTDGPRDDAAACATFGPWSTPVPVPELDLGGNEAGAQISADGLWIVFDSDTTNDLYIATRPDRGSPFGAPVALGAVNTMGVESDPTATDDQLVLLFDRLNPNCIYESTRTSTAAAWGPPVQLAPLCVSGAIGGPYITPDGLELYYNTEVSSFEGALMVTTRTDRTQAFAAGSPVAGLAGLGPSGFVDLSSDGLALYFESGTQLDLYVATRPDRASPFGTPQPVAGVNDPVAVDEDASLTADGLELYFSSDRSTVKAKIHVATRACIAM